MAARGQLMTGKVAAALLAVCAGLALGVPGAEAAVGKQRCKDALSTVEQVGPTRAQRSTLCLLKAERAARGLGGVRSDKGLATVAADHARDMVDRGFFGHVGPDGKRLQARLQASGWIPAQGRWSAGEILAFGTGALGSPAALVDGWLASPEHLAILEDPSFDRIGLGLVAGTPDGDADGVTAAVEFGLRATR